MTLSKHILFIKHPYNSYNVFNVIVTPPPLHFASVLKKLYFPVLGVNEFLFQTDLKFVFSASAENLCLVCFIGFGDVIIIKFFSTFLFKLFFLGTGSSIMFSFLWRVALLDRFFHFFFWLLVEVPELIFF